MFMPDHKMQPCTKNVIVVLLTVILCTQLMYVNVNIKILPIKTISFRMLLGGTNFMKLNINIDQAHELQNPFFPAVEKLHLQSHGG